MPRFAGALIHGAVTVLGVGMAAAGAAALVGSIFLTRPQAADWGAWIPVARNGVLGWGLSFLIAALTAMTILPRRRDLTAPPDRIDAAPPKAAMAILLVIALAATAQIPILLAWTEDSRVAVLQITGGVRDAMGLWIVPTTIAVVSLGIAAVIALIFTVMPAASYAVHPAFALRTLQVLFVLQAGLVAGSALAVSSIHELSVRGLAAASASARPGELTVLTDGVARQGQYVMTLLWRFAWMLAGSVAAIVAWTAAARAAPR